jgi:signal transduction histidine kinase
MENAALYELTDEKLREQTRRLEAIVESLDDGLVLESESGRVLYCNQRALNWLQLARKQAREHSAAQLMQLLLARTDDPAAILEAERVDKGKDYSLYLPPLRVYGRKHDLRIHLFDVTDAKGEFLGRGQLWQDVTRDKELDRMKSALISTVSHELRTPLATIKGYASTLLASDVEWDEASQRDFLNTISLESDRLAKLVKNLLDMSRIEAGMLNINCESYSLNALLLEVVGGFQPPLENRLDQSLADDLPSVWIDVSRIGTVIRNLLDNAVKYSAAGSTIELATRRANGQVMLTVRDHGPGIPEELQDRIFDRFVRADDRLTRQVGGSGLGLAICKGFVEAHKGQVWVDPEADGAVFGFSLPLKRAAEN